MKLYAKHEKLITWTKNLTLFTKTENIVINTYKLKNKNWWLRTKNLNNNYKLKAEY